MRAIPQAAFFARPADPPGRGKLQLEEKIRAGIEDFSARLVFASCRMNVPYRFSVTNPCSIALRAALGVVVASTSVAVWASGAEGKVRFEIPAQRADGALT